MKLTSNTLRTPSALAGAGLVKRGRIAELEQVAARYAVAITPAVADLIDTADPHDPIARQFVPDRRELDLRDEESADPIGRRRAQPGRRRRPPLPGSRLVEAPQRLRGLLPVLLPREMVGPGRGRLSRPALAAALDYIRRTPEIWEVILTGGDPLLLSPRRIAEVMKQLTAIAHVKVIRVHTRIPVAAPELISNAMVRRSEPTRRPSWSSTPIIRANSAKTRALAIARLVGCRHPDAVAVGAAAWRQR